MSARAPVSWRPTVLAAGLMLLAGVAAYYNSFGGSFVYDDDRSIVENRTIRQLWPIGQVLSPPCDGETVGGRPLLNLSLAINYALGGLNVRGYHATNLAIHVAAALLLFGILRRTFLTPVLRDRFGRAATPLALASALVWMLHPLQTESVTYIVQRAESLGGLCYLLTLYCVIRGAGSAGLWPAPAGAGETPALHVKTPALHWQGKQEDGSPRRAGTHRLLFPWYAAAVGACLLGMACKEVLVTAPLVVLLYDRTFLAGSFREAWRQRGKLYMGLAATWFLLAYLVFSTGLIHRQPEMGAPDLWSYARSQPGVILHYLRLSLWPSRLCLEYEWPVASSFWKVVPAAVAVGLLLAATAWGLIRRKVYAFLGAWFLLILAPTSSILPLGQLACEHRVYLPLAAIAVLVVAGGYAQWERLLARSAGQGGQSPFSPGTAPGRMGLWAAKKGTVPDFAAIVRWAAPVGALAAVLLALGYATAARNSVYQSALAIWQDQVDINPNSALAHDSLGISLAAAGKVSEAIEHFHQALQRKPDFAAAHNNLGFALADSGRTGEAIEHYREALRLNPDNAAAHNNLGNALARLGKTQEAIAHYEEALRLKPDYDDAHNNLGNALAPLGRTEEAIEHYREALRLNPAYAEAHNHLAVALAATGRTDEAVKHFDLALRLSPRSPEAHTNLGNALVGLGKIEEAIEHYQQALRLKPDNAAAHNNLGTVLARLGRTEEAIEHYQQALRLKPDFAEAHYNLAKRVDALGRTAEAIEHYQQALRLKPDYVDARNNLGFVLARTGNVEKAIEQWEQALRLKPDYTAARSNLALALTDLGRTAEAVEHYNQILKWTLDSAETLRSLAWLLATHDPAEGGDPARAVQLAQRACELGGAENAQCLDTLAAAYAAAGRFPEAVATAEKALQLAKASGQSRLAASIQARLELYRAGRPYRKVPHSAE